MDAERHHQSEVFAFLQQVSSQDGNLLVLSLKAGITYSLTLPQHCAFTSVFVVCLRLALYFAM